MAQLTIVADIHAHADNVDLLKAELQKLIAPTRAESGCIQYDLHQDNEDPTHFLFFEIWESRDLWQDHMNAPHLTAFQEASDGAIADLVISEMSKVG